MTKCPYCSLGYPEEHAKLIGQPAGPQTGHFTVCYQCAEILVFQADAENKLRKPSDEEVLEVEAVPQYRVLRNIAMKGILERTHGGRLN